MALATKIVTRLGLTVPKNLLSELSPESARLITILDTPFVPCGMTFR